MNGELIPAQAPGGGGAYYEWVDDSVTAGTYNYWLEDVNTQAQPTPHEGVATSYPCTPTAVTVGTLIVGNAPSPIQPWMMAGAWIVFGGLLAGFLRRRRNGM